MLCVLKAICKRNSEQDFHLIYENAEQGLLAFNRISSYIYTDKGDTVTMEKTPNGLFFCADGPSHIYTTTLTIEK